MKSIKTIFKEFKNYKKFLFLAIIFVVFEATADLIIPLFMGKVLNVVTDFNNTTKLKEMWILCIECYALIFIGFLSSITSGIFSAKSACGFSYNARKDMFSKIQDYSFTNLHNIPLQSLITRITVDVTNIEKSSQQAVRYLFRAPIMMSVATILAGTIHWLFGVIYLISIILMLGICLIFFKPIIKILKKQLKAYDELNLTTEESLNNIKLVKSYVREDHEIKKFKNKTQDILKITIHFEKLIYILLPVLFVILYSVQMLTQGISSVKIVFSQLKIGDLATLAIYAMQIFLSLTYFAGGLFIFIMSKASADRIYEVLVENPTIKNKEKPIYELNDGSIEFRNVKFKYKNNSEKFSIDYANFKINQGETVGIIGATGSAKSTLVNLIPRLYDVMEGEVLVGNVNVKDYDLKTLRDNVSIVLQDNLLFSGTLRDNLKWGNQNATDDELKKALNLAEIKDFFEKNSNNYLDMKIEKFGSNLSGGQKQRVSIARSLLKNPKILILDNSTNALDLVTDKKIRRKLDNFRPELTKIIISERISSILNADKIILMDNGKILNIGKHEELLEESKIYREIFLSQSSMQGESKYVKY